MKGGKLKQFFESGPGQARKLELWVRWEGTGTGWAQKPCQERWRGKVSSQGMLGCVVHVHHQSWGGFGVMVTWAQALQSCSMAELSSSTIHLGMVFHHTTTTFPVFFTKPFLIHWTEWMLLLCFILIIHCNGPTSYLLLTIQTLFQR